MKNNKILHKKTIVFILACFFVFGACKKDDLVQFNNWEVLEDTLKLASISSYRINLIATFAGYEEFNKYFDYSISIYKITYNTQYQGNNILASGLICLPEETSEPPPIMAIGNGLIFANHEAPSAFSLPDNFIGYEFVASNGYITLIPDLIGFGASQDILFPIYNYQYSSAPMIDMIKAAKEFLSAKNIESNNQLFLTGYSHGAYVIGATLKTIEENSLDIPVTATAIGAGGYNIPGLMDTLLSGSSFPTPSHLAMIFTSYNTVHQWNRPLTDFFNEEYASKIPSLFAGDYTRLEIEEQLSQDFNELFNPAFLEQLQNHNESQIIDAFYENSINDWKPLSPLRLYHSHNDERIPFSDSEETFNNMIAAGSTTVDFFEITGDDHFNSVFNFMELVLPWFKSFE